MKTDMVKYYYKDLDTGVEMTFTKSLDWGWCIQYHVSKEEMFDMLLSDIVLPWPTLSDIEEAEVQLNYKKLDCRMGRE